MKLIPLSQGKHAIVDDEDYDWLMQWKWCYAQSSRDHGYAIRYEYRTGRDYRNKRIAMHRFIIAAPEGTLVDHRDGDGLNNTRANLRICTYAQNIWNARKQRNRSSQYKGIYLFQGRWMARIKVDQKHIYLGTFDDELDAARAYDTAAREYFGSFAWLNFPGTA